MSRDELRSHEVIGGTEGSIEPPSGDIQVWLKKKRG